MDYSRSAPGAVIGGGYGFQQADMSAQKEALYRQSMNAATPCEAPTRGSESAIHQVTQRLQYLNDLAIRLESFADRVCGLRPPSTSASSGKLAPSQDSLSGKLDLAIMAIEQLNERISDALSRLECFA